MSPRTPVPPVVAAKALFLSDRTCCVCRDKPKGVQIHHIDGDNSNHELENLAVLCGPCHDNTLLTGGFYRKLDQEQVVLYRDDWLRIVSKGRSRTDLLADSDSNPDVTHWELTLATGLAEVYRENADYISLALHYGKLGNDALRDKYVDAAVSAGVDDEMLIFLRSKQGRPDLIPPKAVRRLHLHLQSINDYTQLARMHDSLGNQCEAAKAYAKGLAKLAETGSTFSLAFYLREVAESGIVDALFEKALGEAAEQGDLWWQIRALEELGWHSELRELVLSQENEILESEDSLLKTVLARVKGDAEAFVEATASATREGKRRIT